MKPSHTDAPLAGAISFRVDRADYDLIERIADRACAAARAERFPLDRTSLVMDLTAVHANGCPLRLGDLLTAPAFDFNHDVFGIRRHLDRKTGHLLHCFLPRTAVRQ